MNSRLFATSHPYFKEKGADKAFKVQFWDLQGQDLACEVQALCAISFQIDVLRVPGNVIPASNANSRTFDLAIECKN